MDYSRLIEVRFCSLWYWRICYQEFTLNTGASGVNSESSDEESSEAGQMPLAQHEVLYCVLYTSSFTRNGTNLHQEGRLQLHSLATTNCLTFCYLCSHYLSIGQWPKWIFHSASFNALYVSLWHVLTYNFKNLVCMFTLSCGWHTKFLS